MKALNVQAIGKSRIWEFLGYIA